MPYDPKNPFGLRPSAQAHTPENPRSSVPFQVARVGANTNNAIESIAENLDAVDAAAVFEVWYVYNYMDWLKDLGLTGRVNHETEDFLHVFLSDQTSVVAQRMPRPLKVLDRDRMENSIVCPLPGSVWLWENNESWAEAAAK